jgi:hypothetical protein
MSSSPLAELDAAKFATVLHSRFQVGSTLSRAVDVALVEVSPTRRFGSGAPGAAPAFESFSLLFEGPVSTPLTQGTYSFAHPQMGHFDLFIVPIGRKEQLIQYQAVFNRTVKPA